MCCLIVHMNAHMICTHDVHINPILIITLLLYQIQNQKETEEEAVEKKKNQSKKKQQPKKKWQPKKKGGGEKTICLYCTPVRVLFISNAHLTYPLIFSVQSYPFMSRTNYCKFPWQDCICTLV